MAKIREIYICRSCGSKNTQWKGQCPQCHEWNTLEPSCVDSSAARRTLSGKRPAGDLQPLSSVENYSHRTFGTGLAALDTILGNGFVPGAAILIGGEPGIGKSTLLLQLAGSAAESGRKVVYASGEESLPQIKARADRLGVTQESLLAIATGRVEDLFPILEQQPPDLMVVDSVQTFMSENAEGLPGNVSQVRAVATELVERCKRSGTALILVGHVTKDGILAGPRLLEHLVDTVISLEGDRRETYRMLRVFKNRFGPNQELLIFRMAHKGLELVDDPSTFFLGARDTALSGTAVVMTVDGQRPFAVEIQALATKSYLSIPRRTALGFDVNRLHLLLAVIEKKLRLNFSQFDIYAKIGGGMKMQDPGLDIALVASLLSSFYDIPLPPQSIFWGEIDLNGQIRPVSNHDLRLKQAKALGYAPIFCSPGKGIKGMPALADLHQALFKR